MPVFYDQLNRLINLQVTPRRIISTVPSQTELLFELGLDNKIIGITSFCTHPAGKVNNVTKIGGTKKLNIELIKALKPDLIIANKEENQKEQVEQLMQLCPIWISDINDLPGAIHMIESMGEMLRCKTKAMKITQAITNRFNELTNISVKQRVAYLIWRKPYMAAGRGTFINSMLQYCGLNNAFDLDRYPEITAGTLAKANPGLIFLSSEPYPFKDKHISEFKAIVPNAKIILVDGEMFSWYGSRLSQAPRYFTSLINSITNNS
jgi:ABC-type Fe3+-hydroxamate transport system substrate-binding protein